jgi:ArsR family transcriptional regulator, arsenate/arsenite/antimonite-responsive transcriptional repressor
MASDGTARYAQMLAAMGAEARLQIFRLLLAAHPDGMVVGEIMKETGISPSTLSHHLDKLRNESLVTVQRQGTFLRYRVNTPAVRELLAFFYSECCTRNPVIDLQELVATEAEPTHGCQ